MRELIGKTGACLTFVLIFLQCQTYQAEQSSGNSNKSHVVHIPFSSAERDIKFEKKIILYPKGSPQPDLSADLADAWLLAVPLQTVAANDDGEITRLSSLGLNYNT